MGKPLSMGLRSRALAAVDEGMSCRAAARRFGVAAATVIRWHDQRRSTGGYAAKVQRGDTRSRRIKAHAPVILALHEARRDITLNELRRELGRADVLSQREAWFDGQLDFDSARLVSSTKRGQQPT
ncbi:transposase [Sphingomonas sp. SORGH_AS789]|nr:transposase [Sphingomonas sp. SORGH_AS_0789]MDR6151820.1 transposase [Sphingomonas sp. SORGH_AS_0742]